MRSLDSGADERHCLAGAISIATHWLGSPDCRRRAQDKIRQAADASPIVPPNKALGVDRFSTGGVSGAIKPRTRAGLGRRGFADSWRRALHHIHDDVVQREQVVIHQVASFEDNVEFRHSEVIVLGARGNWIAIP